MHPQLCSPHGDIWVIVHLSEMLSVISAVVVLSAPLVSSSALKPMYGGEIQLQEDLPYLPPTVYADQEIPASWDWREKGLMTTDLNQHIPVYW